MALELFLRKGKQEFHIEEKLQQSDEQTWRHHNTTYVQHTFDLHKKHTKNSYFQLFTTTNIMLHMKHN